MSPPDAGREIEVGPLGKVECLKQCHGRKTRWILKANPDRQGDKKMNCPVLTPGAHALQWPGSGQLGVRVQSDQG